MIGDLEAASCFRRRTAAKAAATKIPVKIKKWTGNHSPIHQSNQLFTFKINQQFIYKLSRYVAFSKNIFSNFLLAIS